MSRVETDPTYAAVLMRVGMQTSTLQLNGPDSVGMLKALASSHRIRILELLSRRSLNVNELAQVLNLSQSTVTRHVQSLERAGIIRTEYKPGVQGMQKRCYLRYDKLLISFEAMKGEEYDVEEVAMPLGLYSVANPTRESCGLASRERMIGRVDDPHAFYRPERTEAQILWMAEGYVEYVFPFELFPEANIRKVELVAELCSDAPLHINEFPSDITVWMNGIRIGTWTCPGDFSDERGRLNPKWWNDNWTQYGFLKAWAVDDKGSYIDGLPSSDVTLDDLGITPLRPIVVRLGIEPEAEHVGGFTLFGSGFGNYEQDLLLRLHYAPVPGLVKSKAPGSQSRTDRRSHLAAAAEQPRK